EITEDEHRADRAKQQGQRDAIAREQLLREARLAEQGHGCEADLAHGDGRRRKQHDQRDLGQRESPARVIAIADRAAAEGRETDRMPDRKAEKRGERDPPIAQIASGIACSEPVESRERRIARGGVERGEEQLLEVDMLQRCDGARERHILDRANDDENRDRGQGEGCEGNPPPPIETLHGWTCSSHQVKTPRTGKWSDARRARSERCTATSARRASPAARTRSSEKIGLREGKLLGAGEGWNCRRIAFRVREVVRHSLRSARTSVAAASSGSSARKAESLAAWWRRSARLRPKCVAMTRSRCPSATTTASIAPRGSRVEKLMSWSRTRSTGWRVNSALPKSRRWVRRLMPAV